MIDLIIFSKNRPMQLCALLDSIERHAQDTFDINVIYTCDDSYVRGYREVAKKHIKPDWRMEQESLSKTTKHLMNICGNSHISFMVDDMLLYRPINLTTDAICNIIKGDVACFSLRLGANTVDQTYSRGGQQQELIYDKAVPINIDCCEHTVSINFKQEYILWNRHLYNPNSNYGYPMSLDGHIFRTDQIKEMVKNHKYNTPNELEVLLYGQSHKVGPTMASFEHSVAVNSPNNRVQSDFDNLFGLTQSVSEADLNALFLEGKRIKIDKMDYSDITGCHQELELVVD